MRFAVIDNNRESMGPDNGRRRGFVQALEPWEFGEDYEFVRYDQIPARLGDLKSCRGLILSGSVFDFATPDEQFDRCTYEKMIPEFRLLLDSPRPVLGICFGHQLLALVEEFEEKRTNFGRLRVNNMSQPESDYLVMPIRMNSGLRFMGRKDLWVQHNHKQEVTCNEALQSYFDVIGGSDQCRVTMMQHKTRDWFGVQFHPEVGRESKQGEISRHNSAVRDGYTLIRDFIGYCLK